MTGVVLRSHQATACSRARRATTTCAAPAGAASSSAWRERKLSRYLVVPRLAVAVAMERRRALQAVLATMRPFDGLDRHPSGPATTRGDHGSNPWFAVNLDDTNLFTNV